MIIKEINITEKKNYGPDEKSFPTLTADNAYSVPQIKKNPTNSTFLFFFPIFRVVRNVKKINYLQPGFCQAFLHCGKRDTCAMEQAQFASAKCIMTSGTVNCKPQPPPP